MPSVAKKFRYRLESYSVVAMAKIIPLLPRPVLLALAKALGRLAFLFDRRGRETGLQNIRAAIAAGTLPDCDPEELIKDSYELFARGICDLFWATRLNADNYSRYIQMEVDDREAYDRATKEGAIWVTPHFGNFEWISLLMGFRGHPFTLVAQDFKNPKLTEVFTRFREQNGHTVISSHRAIIRLLKALKGGGHAALLTDLTLKPDNTSVPVRCFSFETCVTGLHAFLQNRTGAILIPGISIPCEDGTYLMRAVKPIEVPPGTPLADVAQLCWDAFEDTIRDFPAPWLWMYKHWRYRPDGAEGDAYPAYANRSKKFDRWLRDADRKQ
jgi:KDO2-lipid IV(A) lauroyltransferase